MLAVESPYSVKVPTTLVLDEGMVPDRAVYVRFSRKVGNSVNVFCL